MITNYDVIKTCVPLLCFISLGNLKNTTISLRSPQFGKEWHYGQNWPLIGYKICGKQHQSPIRLYSSQATKNSSLNLKLVNYNKRIKSAFVENNGHTVQVGFSDKLKLYVTGSAANNYKYVFEQLHFHWGSYDSIGSEHTIDGNRYPIEFHFVHYKKSYGSFDEAIDKPDGLLVLGVLYQISARNNPDLSPIINLIKDVPKYKDKAIVLKSIVLRTLLPTQLKPHFEYKGSLTTPPCYESVRWIVFKNTMPISEEQTKTFRKCRGEDLNHKSGRHKPLSNNYRPMQSTNDRQIFIT